MRSIIVLLALVLASCRSAAIHRPGQEFWAAIARHCGKAYEGRLVEGTEASDQALGQQRLVMHVRSCSDTEIRIQFHVGENRSRTWVLSRSANGITLKHDHRHEDGSPDHVTQYGGDARGNTGGLTLEFFADEYTGQLVPAARTNIWTMSIARDRAFTYALRREESGRRFRVDFDLTRPVAEPPPAW